MGDARLAEVRLLHARLHCWYRRQMRWLKGRGEAIEGFARSDFQNLQIDPHKLQTNPINVMDDECGRCFLSS